MPDYDRAFRVVAQAQYEKTCKEYAKVYNLDVEGAPPWSSLSEEDHQVWIDMVKELVDALIQEKLLKEEG